MQSASLLRRAAWDCVLFFVPPAYRTVTQDNVDDHVGCVALILICFLMSVPIFISAIQTLSSDVVPVVTTATTVFVGMHLWSFPLLLRITGRLHLLSSYLCGFLYITSALNCMTSGAGFWAINCTMLPVISVITTFLDNNKKSGLRCLMWTGLIAGTYLWLFFFCPDQMLPWDDLKKFNLAGNMFNLFVLAILGSLFSLTRELKQREIELQRDKATALSKVKTEFSANVSHEIRTPLVAIMGLGELLASDMSLTQDQQYFVKTIHSASQDLLNLVNNILTFVKTESLECTGLQLEKTTICLLDLIDETVRFLCTAKSNNVSLMTFVDDSIDNTNCYVEGDPHRIRQVLQNLLSNAIKFCPQDGTGEVCISVRTLESPKLYEICVADNGIGISDSSQHKLFQPFQQADASTTRKYGGTGLGLVICKQVCEWMGGSILLSSKEGVGTHVCFRLPLQSTPPSPQDRGPWFDRKTNSRLRVGIISKSRLLNRIIGEYMGSLCIMDYMSLQPYQLTSTSCDVVIIDIPSAPELVQYTAFPSNVQGVIFLGSFRLKTPTLLWHQQNRTTPAVHFCLSDPVSKFSLAKIIGSICGKNKLAGSIPRINLARAISSIVEHPTEPDPDLPFNTTRELSNIYDTPREVPPYMIPLASCLQKRKREESVSARKKKRTENDPTNQDFGSPDDTQSPDDAFMEDEDVHLKILVAEDNLVNQEVISRQLARMGFTATIVGNGRLALEAYKMQKYDLILMDCQMPEMDGYQSAIAIRQWEREEAVSPPVNIVALSASAMPEETERGLRSGMDDYLAKPIKLSKLGDVVQSVINKKNIHR